MSNTSPTATTRSPRKTKRTSRCTGASAGAASCTGCFAISTTRDCWMCGCGQWLLRLSPPQRVWTPSRRPRDLGCGVGVCARDVRHRFHPLRPGAGQEKSTRSRSSTSSSMFQPLPRCWQLCGIAWMRGGHLIVTTPNPSCIHRRVLGLQKWQMVARPHHINLFTRVGLGQMLSGTLASRCSSTAPSARTSISCVVRHEGAAAASDVPRAEGCEPRRGSIPSAGKPRRPNSSSMANGCREGTRYVS